MTEATDLRWMHYALNLARRNLGIAWPNPAVGCVIVKNNEVMGCGFTAKGGRPHAESMALEQAGITAKGATAYISLEPCAHSGKTEPCAQKLIDAGICRAVIACVDPDSRVNGKGMAMLQAADIAVTQGVLQAQAEALNAGFFSRVTQNRPYIAVKIATSLDGCIAYPTEDGFLSPASGGVGWGHDRQESTLCLPPNLPPSGGGIAPSLLGRKQAWVGQSNPRWITGKPARAYGHMLRSQYDVILTGIGTALADNPLLTCRLPGLENRSPVRVVLDSHARLPRNSALVQSAGQIPLWVIGKKPSAYEAPGVQFFQTSDMSVATIASLLAGQGITRLLVEGGAGVTTSFLQSGFADTLYWFRAPVIIGTKGMAGINALALQRFTLAQSQPLGKDTLEVYTKCSPVSSPT